MKKLNQFRNLRKHLNQNNTSDGDKTTRARFAAPVLVGLGVLILAAIGTFCAFVIFYSFHFLPNTYINGVNVGMMNIGQAALAIYPQTQYRLTITGRGNISDSLTADELNLKYSLDNAKLRAIMDKQNQFAFLIAYTTNNEHTLNFETSYDLAMLEQKINSLKIFDENNIIEPKDAYLGEYDPELKRFRIIPEDPGRAPKKTEIVSLITESIITGQSSLNLDGGDYYRQPNVTVETRELVDLCDGLNKYLSTTIVYDFGPERQELIDADLLYEWTIVKDGKSLVNEDMVREFVQSLADKYDTYGKPREFITASGETKIIEKNKIGYQLDVDKETKNLISYINEGQSASAKPSFAKEGISLGANDLGDTYVEIDLTNQHLYAFVRGELVLESDIVSGNEAKKMGTPAGVHPVAYKKTNAVLRGDDYETPVNYWMPFNGGIGMHDATWRKSFGGTIYRTNGSHGCVNMPLKNAKILYDLVYPGMPVVCYY